MWNPDLENTTAVERVLGARADASEPARVEAKAEATPPTAPRRKRKHRARPTESLERTISEPSTGPPRKRRDPGPIKPGQHLLLKEQMLELVGQSSYSAVWGWMKNLNFPLPIALGPANGRTTKVAWIAEEVFAWIAARPRRDIGGLKQHRLAQEKKPTKRARAARAAR